MKPLDALIIALEIAKPVTAEIPIPGLTTAVECALSIAKKAKEIEDTRDDCQALAERAAESVLAVYQQLNNGGGGMEAAEHVTTFLHNLREIESLMARRLRAGKRDRFWLALNCGKIAKEVKTLTTKLEDSHRNFLIQAALSIHRSMDTLTSGNLSMLQHIEDSEHVGGIVVRDTREIRNGLTQLAQHVRGNATFDGNFRLFAHENLALLEPIVDSGKLHHGMTGQNGDERTLVNAVSLSQTGRVFRHRAVVEAAGDLTGTQVVVYEYPNRGSQQFVQAVNLAKQSRRHPNVLAMLGYSRTGDPDQAAYIVMEDYIPFTEHLSSLRGTRKLRVILQMAAAICMAINHVETQVELCRLLPMYLYWDTSEDIHVIRLDEVVVDHHHGGRIKWARDPLALEKTDNRQTIEVPVMQRDRMRTIEDLRAIAYARVDTVVQHWLSSILSSSRACISDLLPGRSWWQIWEHIADYPRYPLGVWLGCNNFHEAWTCLSAQDPGLEVAVTMESVPIVLPSPRQGHDFYQRLHMRSCFNIPESDLGEMCIELELGTGGGQTRWRRYQFSCIPVNTTLLFRQRVDAPAGLDAASRMMPALPDLSVLQGQHAYIGIAWYRVYFTETTITRSAHATEQVYPPLWFFVLQFDGKNGSARDCNMPTGFWSSEKYPTSVPSGIILDSTPQFEPIEEDSEAPLFTLTQVLGDLVFTTQTKMATEILELTEDELFASREFQKSYYSTSDTDAHDSDDSGGDGVATDDSIAKEGDARDSDAESLASSSSNEDHVLGVNYESPESGDQDATDAGDDSAEEYYSAEEDEAMGLACGKCPS